MEKILIIKLGALGDIAQAEGAIHDIRLHHPDDEITVMTTPAYATLFQRCPWIDAVFIDRRDSRFRLDKMWQLRNRLRFEGFSRVYDLQQVSRTNFYYRWFVPDLPWVGSAKGCEWYCHRPENRCAADHFSLCLQAAGIKPQYTLKSDVSWMADEVDAVLAPYSLTSGYIVLIPGASKEHPEKRWPYYQQLAAYFLAKNMRVVTLPGPDELDLCVGVGGDMLLYQGRYLDIFKLAGVLKKARFVIGNDTGPTHIAAHLRCAGLALFSSHAPAMRSGIQHSRFCWLEEDDLARLSLERVIEKISSCLSPG